MLGGAETKQLREEFPFHERTAELLDVGFVGPIERFGGLRVNAFDEPRLGMARGDALGLDCCFPARFQAIRSIIRRPLRDWMSWMQMAVSALAVAGHADKPSASMQSRLRADRAVVELLKIVTGR